MGKSTMENGGIIKETGRESINGPMEINIRVNGKKIKDRGKGSLPNKMGMFMRVIGRMI